MWAVVGLGNPGTSYKSNRHNIGFCVVDTLAKEYHIRFKKDKILPALIGKGEIGDSEVVLVKSTTYMNRTGIAVKGLSEIYSISLHKLLVISDDIDLPWDKIRIRKNGGSAGHRGVESIIRELATTNFPRLRMGVGRPAHPAGQIVEHVLGNFEAEEKKELSNFCKRASDAVFIIINSSIDTAMNKFN